MMRSTSENMNINEKTVNDGATINEVKQIRTDHDRPKENMTSKDQPQKARRNFTNTTVRVLEPEDVFEVNAAAFLDNTLTLKQKGLLISLMALASRDQSIYFCDKYTRNYFDCTATSLSRALDQLIAKGYIKRVFAHQYFTKEQYRKRDCNTLSKVFFATTGQARFDPRESCNA